MRIGRFTSERDDWPPRRAFRPPTDGKSLGLRSRGLVELTREQAREAVALLAELLLDAAAQERRPADSTPWKRA